MLKSNIKKILLITPPAFTFKTDRDINPMPPMGLGYLAAALERKGVRVKIFDSLIEGAGREEKVTDDLVRIGASFTRIEDEIRNFRPDVVGVSNLFSRQAENAAKVYAAVKKVDPAIIVVAGGAHPTVMPELVMKDRNVDFLILGEGEETIKSLIEYLESRRTIDELDGVAYRDGHEIRVIQKKGFIGDLDAVPFPSWDLMGLERYFGLSDSHGKRHHRRFSPIVTSRGCPVGCAFCTAHHVWGRPFRARSPENVIAEMKELKDRYGIEELMIEDDNVTLDVKRAERLFDLMIEERLGLKWDTPNGVAAFALDKPLIKKMKDSGCYQLNIAVESGNQEVLRNIIKKPLNLDKIRPLVDYAREIGLGVGIFLIIGMPGETIKQMWDSYRFAKSLGIYNPFVSIATPYPGSELYKLCVEKGYIDETSLFEKLYITSASISTENWSGRDVKRVFEKGYMYLQLQYYMRHPALLLKHVAQKVIREPLWFVKKMGVLLCQPTKS